MSKTTGWFRGVGQISVTAAVWILFPITTAVGQTSVSAQSVIQSHPSITDILNPDGTLRTNAPHGSFDAHGYRMTMSKDGSPRFISTAPDPGDKNWDPSFTVAGVGGSTNVVASNADTLYVGGYFSSAGSLVTNNVAKYVVTTKQWLSFDTLSTDLGVNGSVYFILVNGTDVYIGGQFSSAGGIAANNIVQYNSSTGAWSSLGNGSANGTDGSVWIMLVVSGNLYVGGWFTHAGGDSVNHIARWDGTSWHALANGVDGAVEALATSGGSLYVGGRFTHASGSAANYIAQWNGTSWSNVGATATDLNNNIYAMKTTNSGLFIGGSFTMAGAVSANHIAIWDGTQWSAVGAGAGTGGDYVQGFVLIGLKLYALGHFTSAGLLTVNNVVVTDTSTKVWSALGSGTGAGTNGEIWQSASVNDTLYTSGGFSTAGGLSASSVASWNGTTWSALGGTPNAPIGSVYALALSGSNLYVGGSFLTAGNVQANRIALYNTSTHAWSAIGSGTSNGTDNSVNAIAVSGNNVYAGGNFLHAGGLPANHIAMWDGTNWNTLGTTPNDGTDGDVYAMATFGTDLYVGGAFTNAGGNSANYAVKWNGTSWSALGSGLDNYVNTIAAGSSEIYFGGSFANAGGSSANYIASWNGSNWSALGTPTNGVDQAVNSLATYGDTVFVGGQFSNAGGNPASHIAKWNTHEWTVLGAGVGNAVDAMSIDGTNLFIAGIFTTSGLITANRVIEWSITDSSYTTLGDGLNLDAYAIASSGQDAYFGGRFSTAGRKSSSNLAHYNPNGITSVNDNARVVERYDLSQNYPNPFNPTTVINYQLSSVGNVTLKVYDILGREVATLVNERQIAGNHTVSFDGSRFASGVYFYRLVTGNKIQTMKMVLVK